MQSQHHYVCQHRDSAPDDYDVVCCVQEWTHGLPKDISRERVLTGVSREYATLMCCLLDGTVTGDTTRRINFLVGNDTNRVNAENHKLPLIY